MARPKKDSGEIPAELRLEKAFWTLIERFPLREITVNMIVAEAGCARGSFYYHYNDINDLIDSIIERNFPAEIPRILFSFVMTGKDDTRLLTENPLFTEKVDRLCLLVGSHSSVEVIERMKKAVRGAWLDALQFNEDELPQEALILFEFVVNGIIGVFAYRSRPEVDYDIGSCLRVLVPDIPQAFIERFMSIMQNSEHNLDLHSHTLQEARL